MSEHLTLIRNQKCRSAADADPFAAPETMTVSREAAENYAALFRSATIDLSGRLYASGEMVIGGTKVLFDGDPV